MRALPPAFHPACYQASTGGKCGTSTRHLLEQHRYPLCRPCIWSVQAKGVAMATAQQVTRHHHQQRLRTLRGNRCSAGARSGAHRLVWTGPRVRGRAWRKNGGRRRCVKVGVWRARCQSAGPDQPQCRIRAAVQACIDGRHGTHSAGVSPPGRVREGGVHACGRAGPGPLGEGSLLPLDTRRAPPALPRPVDDSNWL